MKALMILALAVASASAYADSVPNRARSLADRGRVAHDARDYTGAITAFTEAYALAPAPGLLFNLAQAYRLRGSCDDAALMYRRFLATTPPDDARGLAESHLAGVERCLAAQITVPTPKQVALRMPGPIPMPKRDKPREDKPDQRVADKVGIGLAIGGGTALLLAGYYGYESHRAESEVERRYAAGDNWRDLQDRAAEGDRASHNAKISLGVGAAALVAGAVVLVIDHRRHRRSLKIEPARGGARIGMSWGF